MSKIVSSPDISLLDFSVLLDMSVAVPTLSVTNMSTVVTAANLQWIFEVISPSGTPIHTGSFTAPDIDGTPFATFNFSETLPQLFGLLEFSKTAGYSVKVSVKDSNGDVFDLTKSKSICKPSGNNGKNNFGAAVIRAEAKCHQGKMYITDQTDLIYKGITGVKVSTAGTLSYPPDSEGTPVTPFTISLMPLLVPIQGGGDGYGLYVAHVYDYDLGDYFYVRVRYSYRESFAVWCDFNLAPLFCEYDKLLALVEKDCTGNTEYDKKIKLINGKLMKAVIGILEPLSGFDVPKLIEEIKTIGGFTCDCCRPQGLSSIGAVVDAGISMGVNKLGGDAYMYWSSDGNGNFILNYADYTYVFTICEDSDSAAFEFQQTTAGYVKTTCLKVDIAVLAAEILQEIETNPTLLNILNSLVTQVQLTCPGLDTEGLFSQDCNYAVQIPAAVAGDTINGITINGVVHSAPTGTLLISDSAIETWLNSLSLGTFTAVYGSNVLTIQSVANVNVVSTVDVGLASDRTYAFSNTCGNICAILQKIIDYLRDLNLLQIQFGGDIDICSIDGIGMPILTHFPAGTPAYTVIAAMNQALCSVVARTRREALNATNLKATFVEYTGNLPVAGDWLGMSKNGTLTKVPLEKLAVAIFALLASDTDVKNMYCQNARCNSVPNCSPVTNLAVTPGDTTAAASWTGVVGAIGYRWSIDGINYNLVIGTAATITGLNDSTTYSLRVRPVYNNGDGVDCEVTLSFDTTGLGALCAEPANLIFSNIGGDSVTISWDAVTGVSGYQYRVNGGSWVNVGDVLTVDLTGLTPSTTYNISVRALVGGSPCIQQADDTFDTVTNEVIVSNVFSGGESGFLVTRLTINALNIYGGAPIESGDAQNVIVPVIANSYTYGVRVITDLAAVDTASVLYHKRGVSTLHTKLFTATEAGATTDVQFDVPFIAEGGDVFEVGVAP